MPNFAAIGLHCVELANDEPQIWAEGMGSAVDTDSTAVAVPLLSEVRQDLVLSYHVLVNILKDVRDLLLLIITHFGPYITVNRFSIIIQFKHVHEAY